MSGSNESPDNPSGAATNRGTKNAPQMSDTLKDHIAQGEDMAAAALREVFGLSLDPASMETSQVQQPSKILDSKHKTQGTGIFKAEDYSDDRKRHLLLACSGSVATIKLPNMLLALSRHSSILSTRVVLTASASHFLTNQSAEQPSVESLRSIPGVDGIYRDEDEWNPAWTRGAPILHIELRRWADALVVAPLSANTLAKFVGGLCDNLLTSVVRAWDTEGVVGFDSSELSQDDSPSHVSGDGQNLMAPRRRKMILVAPAMNTAMWRHPLTAKHIKVLEDDWPWFKLLTPVEKSLACGDVGTGAMKEWSDIVKDLESLLELPAAGSK